MVTTRLPGSADIDIDDIDIEIALQLLRYHFSQFRGSYITFNINGRLSR